MFSSKIFGLSIPAEEQLFQSLFSWMFSSKMSLFIHAVCGSSFNPCSLGCFPRSYPRRISLAMRVVSILVLLDVFLEVSIRLSGKQESLLFQSLFSWMFSSKPHDNYHQMEEKGFNPCSLGCFPRRIRTGLSVNIVMVSILVLLDVFLEVGNPFGQNTAVM